MTFEEKTKLIKRYRGKSLADLRPDLAKEWHPTKNGDLTPEMVLPGSNKKVWWILPYGDTKTGKSLELEWESVINRRASGAACPFITGHAVRAGFNDLATVSPKIAAEWHPTKNGNLTPRDVSASSKTRVWWILPYDDHITGKHFDFEWESTINNRTAGYGCPFLSGKSVWPGFNDLETKFPDLCREWHPTKNGNLTPKDVTATSGKKVWWFLPYDDPITGKHFDFEWESVIAKRTSYGRSCPFLSGQAIWPGFNDLGTKYPDLCREWHPTKNGNLTPKDVTATSGKKVWWFLPYDDPITGKHFDFEWESVIAKRTSYGRGCPFLSGKAVWPGFNDLETKYPDLCKEWHPIKNKRIAPKNVHYGSAEKAWWRCSGGHEWKTAINVRARGCNCPHCNISHGEALINIFCERRSIASLAQYKFNDCVYKQKLPFDRAIFHKNGDLAFLIEYDGEQHFKPVDFSGHSDAEKEFENIKIRDNIKNEYCRKNRIPLVRISYKDYDNIEKILLKKMVRYGLM